MLENKVLDPCEIKADYPDEEGNYFHCPYSDTYGGYPGEMCRNCCGHGVDE